MNKLYNIQTDITRGFKNSLNKIERAHFLNVGQ